MGNPLYSSNGIGFGMVAIHYHTYFFFSEISQIPLWSSGSGVILPQMDIKRQVILSDSFPFSVHDIQL